LLQKKSQREASLRGAEKSTGLSEEMHKTMNELQAGEKQYLAQSFTSSTIGRGDPTSFLRSNVSQRQEEA
jgi:hypothetical protein